MKTSENWNILKKIGFERIGKNSYVLNSLNVVKEDDGTYSLWDEYGEPLYFDANNTYEIIGFMLLNNLIEAEFILKIK